MIKEPEREREREREREMIRHCQKVLNHVSKQDCCSCSLSRLKSAIKPNQEPCCVEFHYDPTACDYLILSTIRHFGGLGAWMALINGFELLAWRTAPSLDRHSAAHQRFL